MRFHVSTKFCGFKGVSNHWSSITTHLPNMEMSPEMRNSVSHHGCAVSGRAELEAGCHRQSAHLMSGWMLGRRGGTRSYWSWTLAWGLGRPSSSFVNLCALNRWVFLLMKIQQEGNMAREPKLPLTHLVIEGEEVGAEVDKVFFWSGLGEGKEEKFPFPLLLVTSRHIQDSTDDSPPSTTVHHPSFWDCAF